LSYTHPSLICRFMKLSSFILLALTTVLLLPNRGVASVVVLHSFNGSDGQSPVASLIQGSDGDFYGTTVNGGTSAVGTVFKISPSGTLTTLHSFPGAAGANPWAGVVMGSDGNFYGTTEFGGASGGGTVFKIPPSGTLTTLHSFDYTDGGQPESSLIQGTDGNFYGTTYNGGASGYGTVFRITPTGTLTTLHSFTKLDGANPNGLIRGSDGNYYGTTAGSANTPPYGTVFLIAPSGTLTTLHSFSWWDGGCPAAGLVEAKDGNFYGTTQFGGASGGGTVFSMTPAGTITTLHSFNGPDGSHPVANLIQAKDGNFYGTTEYGGTPGTGTVFMITTIGTLTTLHSFTGLDGHDPVGGLIQGSDGNFYGTTSYGGYGPNQYCGSYGCGTVFMLHTYVVTPMPSIGGIVHPSIPQTVGSGNNIAFTAVPNAVSTVNKWLLDGLVVQNGGATYTLSNVTTNHTISVTFKQIPPAVPTAVTAAPGNAKVTLSWTASAGATSYNVYRGTTSYGQAATPVATGVTGTTYTNTGLTNGTMYYYRIAAFNAGGNSAESSQVSATPVAPPPVPTGLTAVVGAGKVTLTWTASAGATSYNVYRGTTSFGQSATPIAMGVVGTTYVNTGLTTGVTYYYRIAAFNAGGNSAEGNQASATP